MLKCSDVTELATDHMDGALSTRESLAVRLHLALCSFCRRHFRQLGQTVGLLNMLPLEQPAPGTEESIVAELKPAE
jgi:predicted anti-sigma-YlaC factor YlaD